jgi:hypothetical protein
MISFVILVVIIGALIGFLFWLALRARKGKISVTTPLGTNYALFNRDQRHAAEVIANKGASKKEEEQTSSDGPC